MSRMRQYGTFSKLHQGGVCLLGCVLLMSMLFSHCDANHGAKIAAYYFPVEDLKEGTVYEYHFEGNLAPEYWYVKSFSDGDSTILTITVYDAMQQQLQLSRERQFPSGWVQRDLFLYDHDSTGMKRMDVDIISDDLYPFQIRDSLDVTFYAASWTSGQEGEKIENRLYRNRRWLGFDTLQILDEPVPAVVFRVDDWIEDEREGTLRIEVEAREYYGKGLGLVKKDQYIKGELFRSMQLADTFSMKEFEQMYKERTEYE